LKTKREAEKDLHITAADNNIEPVNLLEETFKLNNVTEENNKVLVVAGEMHSNKTVDNNNGNAVTIVESRSTSVSDGPTIVPSKEEELQHSIDEQKVQRWNQQT